MQGVLRRIEGHQKLAERQFVPVTLDQVADIVAAQLRRKRRERPEAPLQEEKVSTSRKTPRMVVARNDDHAMVRLAPDRSLLADEFKAGVGVVDQRRVGEEIDSATWS